MSRLSIGGSIRLHDLLEASDDEYGFVRNDVEKALDVREATEDEIMRQSPMKMMSKSGKKLPEENVIPAGGASLKKSSITGSADEIEKSSIGSNDSKKDKENVQEHGKLGALIDKAKRKGQKLVAGHHGRKKHNSEGGSEESISKANSARSLESLERSERSESHDIASTSAGATDHPTADREDSQDGDQRKRSEAEDPGHLTVQTIVQKFRVLPFFRARMVVFGTLIAMTLSWPGFISGLLWGFYTTIIGFLYFFVSEPKSKEVEEEQWIYEEMESSTRAATTEQEEGFGLGEGVVYRGWMNELRTRYSPVTYHVNNAQSVLVRLEGSMLRICRPAKAVLKHAFYDDPTLKQTQPSMVSQVIYDMKDAHVSLRPKRLARRRWWSRKYPIHIRFSHSSSTLVQIDHSGRSKGMVRSASTAPYPSISEGSDRMMIEEEGEEDEAYAAESETDLEEDGGDQQRKMLGRIQRANSASDINEFKSENDGKTAKKRGSNIYLFVRAAREKERWFHLLREACAKAKSSSSKSQRSTSTIGKSRSSTSLPDDMKPDDSGGGSVALDALLIEDPDQQLADTVFATPPPQPSQLPRGYEYLKYRSNYASFVKEIATILSIHIPPKPEKNSTVSVDLGTMKWQPGKTQISSELVDSINVLATRIFFDFCRDDFWIQQVKQKIQSKLATIHLPYFIEKLELGELKFGTKAPRFTAVYTPKVDEWGTWVDFEMKYRGGIRLVLQTSVNLLKLQSGAQQVDTEKRVNRWTEAVRVTRYSDSELPESPESSPDEDFGAKNRSEGTNKERTGKKLLSLVERAAQSSFFQKAAKLQAVAKLIEDVSTTPLMLNVEVEVVEGPMTCNIPPPPSDRLWYAFRRRPIFKLRAIPQVGDRSVDLSTVSEWIETKLRQVLEKNLVCPNMDDIILPVLSGNPLLHMGYNK